MATTVVILHHRRHDFILCPWATDTHHTSIARILEEEGPSRIHLCGPSGMHQTASLPLIFKIRPFRDFVSGSRCTTSGAIHSKLSIRITLEELGAGLSIHAVEAAESQMVLSCPTPPMHYALIQMMLERGGSSRFGCLLTPISGAIACHYFYLLVPCSAKNLSTPGYKVCCNFIP